MSTRIEIISRKLCKRKWSATLLAALTALLPATALAQPDSGCRLVEVSSVPMSTSGAIAAPASIAGLDLSLMVETDGSASLLATEKADALGLPRHGLGGNLFTLYGGYKPKEFALANNVRIGKLSSPEWSFVLVPASLLPGGTDGTLAPDLLHSYDVEIDFAKATLRLLSQDHCEGQVIYWTKDPVAVVPMTLDTGYRITVPVVLDGVPIKAEIDTGTSGSILSEDFAASSYDHRSGAGWNFRTLSFEGVSIGSPRIDVVPDSVSGRNTSAGVPPLIIGRDILSHFHVYIAYGEKRLYLTARDAH